MMFIGKMYGGGGDVRMTQLRGQRMVFASIDRTRKIGKMFRKKTEQSKDNNNCTGRTVVYTGQGAVAGVVEPKFRETVRA